MTQSPEHDCSEQGHIWAWGQSSCVVCGDEHDGEPGVDPHPDDLTAGLPAEED